MNFNRQARRRDLSDINVTSLVDIIFNLLVFFLLTTSFSQSAGVEVQLPSAASADTKLTSQDLIVALTREGVTVVQGESVDAEGLAAALKQHKERADAGAVVVQADQEVPHGEVVKVIDAAKKLGLRSIAIATRAGS